MQKKKLFLQFCGSSPQEIQHKDALFAILSTDFYIFSLFNSFAVYKLKTEQRILQLWTRLDTEGATYLALYKRLPETKLLETLNCCFVKKTKLQIKNWHAQTTNQELLLKLNYI